MKSFETRTHENQACATALNPGLAPHAITVCAVNDDSEMCETNVSSVHGGVIHEHDQRHSGSPPQSKGFSPWFDSPRACLERFADVYRENVEVQYEFGRLLEGYGALEQAREAYAKVPCVCVFVCVCACLFVCVFVCLCVRE